MSEKITIKETINGLQNMIQSKKFIEHNFDGVVDEDICERAIELLKEQEPILLENQHKPYGHSTSANSPWISRCPKCDKKIEGRQTRFCKYCGQAVKWE